MPDFSSDEIQAMQRAVSNLFDKWELTDDQAAILLGGIAPSTYNLWKAEEYGDVGPDLAERLSNFHGIRNELRLLFQEPQRINGWIKRPNKDFKGQTALDLMLSGKLSDIKKVRYYLV